MGTDAESWGKGQTQGSSQGRILRPQPHPGSGFQNLPAKLLCSVSPGPTQQVGGSRRRGSQGSGVCEGRHVVGLITGRGWPGAKAGWAGCSGPRVRSWVLTAGPAATWLGLLAWG